MKNLFLITALAFAAVMLGACDRAMPPTSPDTNSTAITAGTNPPAPPTELVDVDIPGGTIKFWPYTGTNFTGTPQDPINLIFLGQADPRDVRAALLSLDGDRTAFGFPNEFPFNCTWRDALGGDMQTAYTEAGGWVGSAVQLECGDYRVMRFHMRLFQAGDYTVGNAHLDLLIPNTTSHQVISWELAEQLVIVDLLRSGLLHDTVPLFPTGSINAAPFRGIPSVIYNGMPPELRSLIGGPEENIPDGDSVGIQTDGSATVFNLVRQAEALPGSDTQEIVVEFDQVIPKPFCTSSPWDYLYVKGPVLLKQTTTLTPSGNLSTRFHASGILEITPVNPLTSPPTPIGETYRAIVNQHDRALITDKVTLVSSFQLQIELPPVGADRGRLMVSLNVGPGQAYNYDITADCEP